MPETRTSGVRIRYIATGDGDPLILIHGFSANVQTNWRISGCLDAFASQYRVIAPDLRGHGHSEKPHHTRDYSIETLAADILAVMDREGVECARIVGYSMGGMVALKLLLDHPERVRAAVIGGMGVTFPHSISHWRMTPAQRSTPAGRPARRFSPHFLRAYLGRLDPLAMYAVYRGVLCDAHPVDTTRLPAIDVPVLCIAGSRDHASTRSCELAAAIPGARFVSLSGQSHLSAPADPRFNQAILDFLGTT